MRTETIEIGPLVLAVKTKYDTKNEGLNLICYKITRIKFIDHLLFLLQLFLYIIELIHINCIIIRYRTFFIVFHPFIQSFIPEEFDTDDNGSINWFVKFFENCIWLFISFFLRTKIFGLEMPIIYAPNNFSQRNRSQIIWTICCFWKHKDLVCVVVTEIESFYTK